MWLVKVNVLKHLETFLLLSAFFSVAILQQLRTMWSRVSKLWSFLDIRVAVIPVAGLSWSIPKARPTNGWKTWRKPTTYTSSNYPTGTLYVPWRTAYSLALPYWWRISERNLIPCWNPCSSSRPSSRAVPSASSWETVRLNTARISSSTWPQSSGTPTTCQRRLSRYDCSKSNLWYYTKKATIHQVTMVLVTSENVLFPGHNHLQTTSANDSLALGR